MRHNIILLYFRVFFFACFLLGTYIRSTVHQSTLVTNALGVGTVASVFLSLRSSRYNYYLLLYVLFLPSILLDFTLQFIYYSKSQPLTDIERIKATLAFFDDALYTSVLSLVCERLTSLARSSLRAKSVHL